jgi:teichoic acid transport system permease protein
VPPALVLMSMFNLGIAFIAARVTDPRPRPGAAHPVHQPGAVLRQRRVLLGQLTVGSQTGKAEILAMFMEYNPVHIYIQLVRHGLLTPDPKEASGAYATPGMWIMGAAWGVGLMILGFVYFWLAEERYGRE